MHICNTRPPTALIGQCPCCFHLVIGVCARTPFIDDGDLVTAASPRRFSRQQYIFAACPLILAADWAVIGGQTV